MRTSLLLLLLLSSSQLSFSQAKWDVRLFVNYLQCFSQVDKLHWESTKNRTDIKPNTYSPAKSMYINDVFGSKFPEISIFRNISPRHSVSVGFLDLNCYLSYSIKTVGESTVIGIDFIESVGQMPAIKLNYHYSLYKGVHRKNIFSSASVSGGTLLFLKGHESKYEPLLGNGGRIEQSTYDFSGNLVETIYVERHLKENGRPNPIIPCFNVGANCDIFLSKRFKFGMDVAAYLSSNSLYSRVYQGETTDTKYTFQVKLKPYFFSGGLYLQYLIK